ncbi:uncharacterized protein LOC143431587 [Xylocopa sonorina]|uniref:uncharacterized protein LOC143431587 n=1 Tax=Xylocopa sonorina TaxID=1818115 RepID=UPI00403A8717
MQDFFSIVRVITLALICRITEINGGKMKKEEDSVCHPFPFRIIFEQNKIDKLENGSLEYNKLVYPVGSYHVSGNDTYGCVCDVRACLKKCCKRNEILGESDRPKCTRLSNGLPARDLALKSHELATEIQGISGISELFLLVEDMQCPENMSIRYMLEPEHYEEDSFVLDVNGTLHTRKKHFPAWSYCLDWKESFEKVVVLVCELADTRNDEKKVEKEGQQEYFNVGIMVSIPFFFATFLVYAIIPELRNLYGKTLMCYVGCLVLAYTFLVLAKLLYLPLAFCYTIVTIGLVLAILTTKSVHLASRLSYTFSAISSTKSTVYLTTTTDNSSENVTPFDSSRNGEKSENVFTTRVAEDTIRPVNRGRVNICCPYSSHFVHDRCVETNSTFRFPPVYDSGNLTMIDETPDYRRYFELFVFYPCTSGRYKLNPDKYPNEAFKVLDNGSIYLYNVGPENEPILGETEYCFDNVYSDVYDVILCLQMEPTAEEDTIKIAVGLIVSLPFLFITFVVYTVIPELKNIHGCTLRAYIGPLMIAYLTLAIAQIIPQDQIPDTLCIAFACIMYFSFLASFFWLNVMCFDIWWTFGGFRSLQGSVKQRERKKFLIYSIYAWGCASLLTVVCITMQFFPDIPKYFIKPQFGSQSCWFDTDKAKAIYFYGPMGITVFCNICLFISTALKIVQHKKDTAHHLKGMNSRRHDDNKQWFNLYLKLFIVMGINWSMELISWLCNNTPSYIWYLTDLTNTLQGVIIFLIFVCKNKIKRLLLKKFNCHGSNVLSRNSTRSTYHSTTASRTCMTSITPLQEKIIPHSNKPGDVTIDN